MRIDEYPRQEPLTELGVAYQQNCLRLSDGLVGEEFFYAKDDPCQGILVFPAERPNGSMLCWMHGGGWTNGYKEMMAFMAPPLNAAGISFATFSYRMAPSTIFPDGWLDAGRAIAWLHANAERFGADPRRIFIGGHSAGGHYAALLAVREDWQAKVGIPVDGVRGCLTISGIYDFTPGNGMAVRPRFLGVEGTSSEVDASPLFNLHRLPPMLIAHGENDFPHLPVQAKKFEAVLKAKGADVQRLELAGRDHFTSCYAAAEADGPWAQPAIAWMNAH